MVTRTYCDRCASQLSVGKILFGRETENSRAWFPERDLCRKCSGELDTMITKFIQTPPENS